MNNIYTENPLKIVVVNPYNSNVIKQVCIPDTCNVRGGAAAHKTQRDLLQQADFSVLDKDIDNLKDIKINQNEYEQKGSPESVMVYPQTTVVNLRYKIFIATGIQPHRQYLVLTNNCNILSLPYSIYSGQDMIETNLFSALQTTTEQQILNIPFDLNMVNSKQDITIEMNDTFLPLVSNTRVIRVIVCDLYTILDPANDALKDILTASIYQKELIYYGFILKFFPLLPLEGFEQIYINRSNVSYIFPNLSPEYGQLETIQKDEKYLLDNLFDSIPDTKKYIKKISQRQTYAITQIDAHVKIPTINIRNLFDLFELNDIYVVSAIKLLINGKIYIAEKRYTLYTDHEDAINTDKMLVDSLIVMTNDNINITIYKDNIYIKTSYNENDAVDFDEASKLIGDVIKYIINYINKLGLIVILDGDIIDKKLITVNIVNSNVIIYWPESLSSSQFSEFKTFLGDYEDINFLTVLQSNTGIYSCVLHTGSQQLNPQKKYNLLQQYPNIKNQYDYYTNNDFRQRWNDLTKKTLLFTQKASNTTITVTGFDKNSFESTYELLLSLMYTFSKRLRKEKKIIKMDDEGTKTLKKLKGVDPELYDLKRHDPKYQVYSIKCQSDRQPTIYKQNELQYLSKNIKNKLVKFWNFTEERPVYYHCPNKVYPHLSFRPQDHPLGYCLPCCKKLVPSETSRQSKIDAACYIKQILPHKDIDIIIKKLDKETTHLLTYGKDIPIGRLSKIPPIIENNLLLTKTSYRLIGVNQTLPLFEDAGLVYSIIYCLGISLDEYARGITKIINNNTLNLLDQGYTTMFDSADHLKEVIINMLVDKNRMTIGLDMSILNWVNIISELTYMAYGIHTIILTDYDNNLKLNITNTTKICLLTKNCEATYIILSAHDNGIYPIITSNFLQQGKQYPNGMFQKDDTMVKAIIEMLEADNTKIQHVGMTLIDIIEFVDSNKDYKIDHLLRGKKGLIYAAILSLDNDKIYWPCIYSEYLDSRYKVSTTFPNIKSFKRNILYDCVDDFNSFITKKGKRSGVKSVGYIDPFAVIKYKDQYIGFKARFLDNKFGTTFYHGPEKTSGRYNLNVIDIPYDIMDVNNAISKQSHHEISPKIGQYAYNNYIYTLFLTEFSYEIRKHKNVKIREQLQEILSIRSQVDRRNIKEVLKKYEGDYKVIIRLLSLNHHSKVLSMIKHMIFDFDMLMLQKLKAMSISERKKSIESTMKPYIQFTKSTPNISNIIASCQTEAKLEQCDRNKLLMNQENFHKCCELLSNDLGIPYLYETISLHISTTISKLQFTKRVTEILNIREYS